MRGEGGGVGGAGVGGTKLRGRPIEDEGIYYDAELKCQQQTNASKGSHNQLQGMNMQLPA